MTHPRIGNQVNIHRFLKGAVYKVGLQKILLWDVYTNTMFLTD